MFVLIKNVHLLGITNGVSTVVICAILGLNAVNSYNRYAVSCQKNEYLIYGSENGAWSTYRTPCR